MADESVYREYSSRSYQAHGRYRFVEGGLRKCVQDDRAKVVQSYQLAMLRRLQGRVRILHPIQSIRRPLGHRRG